MPKLLTAILLLGLVSCNTVKKFTGNYVSNDSGTNFTKLILNFTTDSTLQFISIGAHNDSVPGMYNVTKDRILHVKFKYANLYSKSRILDSIPITYLFPFYSDLHDSVWWNIVLKIHNHRISAISESPREKEGYTPSKHAHFQFYYKWFYFKKEELPPTK